MKKAEAYSKKKNLIFLNVEENRNENSADLMNKLGKILHFMDLDLSKILIDNIHRLPSNNNSNKPVIVKFARRLDRDQVWVRKNLLKQRGCNVYVKEHLSQEVESNVRKLLPIMRAAIDQGFARLRLLADKLQVNGQFYTVKNLHLLPESLKPENLATRVIDNHTFFFTASCPLSNFAPMGF